MPEEIISIKRLTKRFGDIGAVDGLDLTVNAGEMFALVGPDGAGKTTTIRMLCGILRPDGGTAEVLGHRLPDEAALVKPRIGYLSQQFSMYADLTVDENIAFFAGIHRVKDFAERRDRLLAFTRMEAFRNRLAGRLSGGMKQKLALVCTLVHTPEIILLDEPTTGVDPVSRRDFWKILSDLLRDGITIIMSTPYLDEAERCTRVALMDRGRVIAADTPRNLRSLMPGAVVEVVCRPVRRAAETLEHAAGITGVQTFGDRVHVVTADADADVAALREDLERAGITVTAARTVVPSLENVFISLVRLEDASA